MKHTIRLNEGQLRKMIAESVKKVLREYNEPFPYDYKDAREREDYYQRAVQHDFPDEGHFKTGRSWEDMYYDLTDKKNQADRERQKLDKQKARDERKQAMVQKKAATAERKNKINRTWAKAVREALTGSDDLSTDYDGLMDLPLILKDGSQVMFHAHSFMEPEDYIDNGMGNVYDGFSLRVAGEIDGQEETEEMPEISMSVTTYVSPMDVEVAPVIKNVDNVIPRATKVAITKAAKKEAVKRYRQLMKMQ